MRGNCEELAPQYDRDVVCCSRCLLVQFVRSDERCRRCGQSFAPVALAVDKSDSSASDRESVVLDAGKRSNRALTLGNGCSSEPQTVNLAFAYRIIRQAFGLSQKRLSKLTGLPRTYYSKIENGDTDPTLDSIERFAKAFDLPTVVVVILATLDNDSDSGTMQRGREKRRTKNS